MSVLFKSVQNPPMEENNMFNFYCTFCIQVYVKALFRTQNMQD